MASSSSSSLLPHGVAATNMAAPTTTTTTPQGGGPPAWEEAFRDGIFAVFSRWVTLRMIIDQEWAGTNSRQKVNDLFTFFLDEVLLNRRRAPLTATKDSDVDKVAQFLRVKFYEDLCTELEDGSDLGVAAKCLQLLDACRKGDLSLAKAEVEKAAAQENAQRVAKACRVEDKIEYAAAETAEVSIEQQIQNALLGGGSDGSSSSNVVVLNNNKVPVIEQTINAAAANINGIVPAANDNIFAPASQTQFLKTLSDSEDDNCEDDGDEDVEMGDGDDDTGDINGMQSERGPAQTQVGHHAVSEMENDGFQMAPRRR